LSVEVEWVLKLINKQMTKTNSISTLLLLLLFKSFILKLNQTMNNPNKKYILYVLIFIIITMYMLINDGNSTNNNNNEIKDDEFPLIPLSKVNIEQQTIEISPQTENPTTPNENQLFYDPNDPDPPTNILFTINDAIRLTSIEPTAYYLLPTSTSVTNQQQPNNNIHDILLLFHGCTHGAEDWFELPEERRIVKHALSMNLIVVVISSLDRVSGCWSQHFPPGINSDVKNVLSVMEELKTTTTNLIDTSSRWFGFGASSGGTFVSILGYYKQQQQTEVLLLLDGIIIEISPGSPLVWNSIASSSKIISDNKPIMYPPTCFIWMSRDVTWASKDNIKSVQDMLHKANLDVISYEIKPKPIISAQYFEYRMGGKDFLTLSLAETMLNILVEQGYMGKLTGELLANPRSYPIRNLLSPSQQEQLFNERQMNGISEILNERWGEHELSSQYFVLAMDGLVKGRRGVHKGFIR
jgi:hypothetical protein